MASIENYTELPGRTGTNSGLKEQVGFVSAVLFFLGVFGLGITLTVSSMVTNNQSISIDSSCVQIVLMVILLYGSGLMVCYVKNGVIPMTFFKTDVDFVDGC